MNLVPIIPGLVRDNSVVIWEQMDGSARYRMSMVSREWRCISECYIYNITTDKQLKSAIQNMDILSIIQHFNSIDYNSNILYYACKYGNMELVSILVRMGASDLNWGLFGACKGGNIEIVQLMITKGASDLNWGLCLVHVVVVI